MAESPTFKAPDFRHGLSGTDENGRRRNYTEAEGRALGTDGYGMPMSESGWGGETSSRPRKKSGTGSKKINHLVKNLDDVSLDSGTTIHEFFEAVRNLAHQIGFQVELGLADIRARAEHDAKKNSHWYAMGVDVKLKMRRVDKEAKVIVDSLSDAAGAAIRTWSTIEDEIIEPMLEAQGAKRRPEVKSVDWTA